MNKNTKFVLILIVLSYFFLVFGNGLVSLTDPDEVFYTLSAREMVENNSWLTPYIFGQPQFEKPILTYFLIRVAFVIFGMTFFAARFFPALFGLLGVLAVYFLGVLGFKNEKKAFICSLALMSSGLYIGLSRTVFTDMIFSVLILFSLLAFYWGYSLKKRKEAGLFLFFVFSGFACLAKGPLGLFVPFLSVIVFLGIRKELKFLLSKGFFLGAAAFILIAVPWYVLMIQKYGQVFIQEFFVNDHIRRILEAEHLSNDTWYFYPFSMIGCMFPWSIFVAVSVVTLFKNFRKADPMQLFLISWIGVTFLIFQPAHSKLVSYIFPLFPALALAAGDFMYNTAVLENRNRVFFRIGLVMLIILGLLPFGVVFASVKFGSFLSSKLPIFAFVSVFIAIYSCLWVFLVRYKFFKFIYMSCLLVLMFLSVIPLARNDIEPHICSRWSSEYLIKNHDVQGTVLASKFFARGVRFYTGKNMAVIDVPGKNFFSPHPVPFLNNDLKVTEFLSSQPVTFCILKKASFIDLQRIAQAAGKFKCELLKQIGNQYVVKIQRL